MLTKPLINFADPFLTYVRIAKLICAEPLIMMPNVMEHLWTLLTFDSWSPWHGKKQRARMTVVK